MALRAVGVALLSAAALVASPAGVAAASDDADGGLKVEVESLLTSDYIYRGVTLSAHRPSAAMSVEVDWQKFYFSTNIQSVKLPTNPAAEVTFAGGYRWDICDFEFDLAASYFYYPGEIPPDGGTKTNYWEYSLHVTRALESTGVTLEALVAYSPDVSQTGAWGAYADGQVSFELTRYKLLNDLPWRLIAGGGYWQFGNTSAEQGGFPLPSYANWHVGLEFDLNDYLTLNFTYSDTSLSREDCFVFTGDPAATPGGAIDPVSNPQGLRSQWCGAAFVGTLTATLDFPKSK
ncbi:MAG TPA: TorF family putative porin [Xanthobacteraceae bacterium]|nr:TorF family putative porin [Xanthobacteraceae bacterium]